MWYVPETVKSPDGLGSRKGGKYYWKKYFGARSIKVLAYQSLRNLYLVWHDIRAIDDFEQVNEMKTLSAAL